MKKADPSLVGQEVMILRTRAPIRGTLAQLVGT